MIMNMKKSILYSLLALTLSLFCASCIHKGDLNIEPVPKIDFSLTKVDGYTYTLTNLTEGATNVKWAILSFKGSEKTVVLEGSGDSFTFTFPSIGTYWIQMSATREGHEETIYTAKLIDKASDIKLDDDSFDDWDGITRDDFQLRGRWISTPESEREGKNAFVDGKIDYDGDYVYLFFRVNPGYTEAPMVYMEDGDDANEFIMFINSDGDLTTTGATQGGSYKGYEHGAEFGFWEGEGYPGFIDTSEGWDGVSDGVQAKLEPSVVFGTAKEVDGLWCFEMGLNRAILGITTSAFGLNFQITSDWDTCDFLINSEGDTDMVFKLVVEE